MKSVDIMTKRYPLGLVKETCVPMVLKDYDALKFTYLHPIEYVGLAVSQDDFREHLSNLTLLAKRNASIGGDLGSHAVKNSIEL